MPARLAPQLGKIVAGDESNEEEQSVKNDFMINIPSNTKYWAHPLRKGWTQAERTDLTETVLFSSANKTKDGTIKGSFQLSDLITQFRIIANSIDINGRLGYVQSSFQVQKSLYISFDAPITMALGDILRVDVKVTNLNTNGLTLKLLKESNDTGFSCFIIKPIFEIKAKSSVVQPVLLVASKVTEQSFLRIGVSGTYNGMELSDTLELPIKIVPTGFARTQTAGGFIGS